MQCIVQVYIAFADAPVSFQLLARTACHTAKRWKTFQILHNNIQQKYFF